MVRRSLWDAVVAPSDTQNEAQLSFSVSGF